MIGKLILDLWPYIAGLVALIAGAGWLRRDAKKDAKRDAALAAAEAQKKTLTEIKEAQHEAERDFGADPAAARRWLHERAQQ